MPEGEFDGGDLGGIAVGEVGDVAFFDFAVLAEGFAEGEAIERAIVYAALSTLAVGTQKSFATRERFEEEWAKRGK